MSYYIWNSNNRIILLIHYKESLELSHLIAVEFGNTYDEDDFAPFLIVEDSLDIEIACSHVRSWFLFVESLKSQRGECKFHSWPCKRRFGSFSAGSCFPPEGTTTAPEMGYAADRGPTGLYYLATRSEYPFCGIPLRAAVKVSDTEYRPKGILRMLVENGKSTTEFSIICEWVFFGFNSFVINWFSI